MNLAIPTVALGAFLAGLGPFQRSSESGKVPPFRPGVVSSPRVAFGDFDGDRLLDALAIGPEGDLRLLRNLGDGAFDDVSAFAGLGAVQGASLVLWEDYDRDQRLDLFVATACGARHLFHNQGAGRFEDVAASSGLGGESCGEQSAQWIDYDQDERLDLLLEGAAGGRLYHALADGRFEEQVIVLGPAESSAAASLVLTTSASASVVAVGNADSEHGGMSSHGAIRTPVAPGTGPRTPPAPSPGGTHFQALPTTCVVSIRDQANPGQCLQASSVPTPGLLYPPPHDGGVNNVSSGTNSFIGGGQNNQATNGGFGALGHTTVGGGRNNLASGNYATVGGGRSNVASGYSATVGGGVANTASTYTATVSGGFYNVASGYSATIGGGDNNTASGSSATVGGGGSFLYQGANTASGSFATVSGGVGNTASGYKATVGGGGATLVCGRGCLPPGSWVGGNTASGEGAAVSGGEDNTASGENSTVGGGGGFVPFGPSLSNVASGVAATVPGGRTNTAQGDYSFAAGRRAKANHSGAFVWGDSQDADKTSSASDEFNVYASGGARIFSDSTATAGVLLAPGAGSWSSVSDRAAKENVEPVDARAVLERVCALPISTWNYESQDESIRHMGPMAQDFHAAFGLGVSDTTIDTIDPDGVALAAIQGLNERVSALLLAKDAELAALREANAALTARVSRLESLGSSSALPPGRGAER